MGKENLGREKMNYAPRVDSFMPPEIKVPVDRPEYAERKLDEIDLRRKYKEAYRCIERVAGS